MSWPPCREPSAHTAARSTAARMAGASPRRTVGGCLCSTLGGHPAVDVAEGPERWFSKGIGTVDAFVLAFVLDFVLPACQLWLRRHRGHDRDYGRDCWVLLGTAGGRAVADLSHPGSQPSVPSLLDRQQSLQPVRRTGFPARLTVRTGVLALRGRGERSVLLTVVAHRAGCR